MPTPDAAGWYRVRRKGDPTSPVWSTRVYDQETESIHPGRASDIYGEALPPKLHATLAVAPETPESTPNDEGENNGD
ncbi:hypothetical protein [Oribacterium sp. HCP3S3_B9]|uniref:hypothetical protein n=1 Tax=Oribacterium sp. HCP3S3_B9 TaxID=3438946 RepID=UPI003F8C8609